MDFASSRGVSPKMMKKKWWTRLAGDDEESPDSLFSRENLGFSIKYDFPEEEKTGFFFGVFF